MQHTILAINPGSTSTKAGLFASGTALWSAETSHSKEELEQYDSVVAQLPLRRRAILDMLERNRTSLSDLDCVVGRGGLLPPIPGGTYAVSNTMLQDLRTARHGEHPCNLGAILADEMAGDLPAFIVDPPTCDDLAPVSRITGHPEICRRSLFHALSQKAVVRHAARDLDIPLGDTRMIVAHMGGGISIGAHRRGRVVDVVNGLDGEGPFTAERTGALPLLPLLDMIQAGHTVDELRTTITRRGGLWALLGTNDLREVSRRMEEEPKTALIFDALAYNVAKGIASMAVPLQGDNGGPIHCVVLTGGMARCRPLVTAISKRISFLAPLLIYPETDELAALATGAQLVLEGKDRAREYMPEKTP
ncbi:MAG TPA: butyrate kinase [Desulfomicrobiaceae bacterium]|nr:butyrate kinase [Desulfomicrobiaceae bacterium]